MIISEIKAQTLLIEDVMPLDTVTAVFVDEGPSCGRLVIECCGGAWATRWASMGSKTVRAFVAGLDPEYLMRCLVRGRRTSRAEAAYVLHLAETVRGAAAASCLVRDLEEAGHLKPRHAK